MSRAAPGRGGVAGEREREEAESRLREGALRVLGRALTPVEVGRLVGFVGLVQRWNKVHRLVGSGETKWIMENVVLDSLVFTKVVPDGCLRLADVGSGCGAPGIPLKVVLPGIEVFLVEARERRVSFLRAAVRELGLVGLRCVAGRAEGLTAEDFAGPVDVVGARGVGGADRVAAASRGFVRPGGRVIVAGPPTGIGPGIAGRVVVEGVRAGSRRGFAIEAV